MATDARLHFTRREGGAVRIHVTDDRDQLVSEFLMSQDVWASAVASVSAQGASPDRVGLVRNFHMYEPAGVDANGSPVDESAFPLHT
ncbi:MAG TPA: hypothetical protein VGH91_04570 [Gammaproteobacteria bacterium]|jgi:hypothetical protein